MQKLLSRLEGSDDRCAQFRTVICLARKNDIADYTLFEGVVRGTISTEKQGTEGFGYDPIFVPEGYTESFAQLGMDIKNGISHRARAVATAAAGTGDKDRGTQDRSCGARRTRPRCERERDRSPVRA